MLDLVQTLKKINQAHGQGELTNININLEESEPNQGLWHGTATQFVWKNPSEGWVSITKMWKSDGRVVTFLGHRKTLYVALKR